MIEPHNQVVSTKAKHVIWWS